MKFKIILLCFFIHCLSYAQTHTHKASISKPAKDGLYRIAINPDVRCNSSIDLRDLRILDNKQREVPYVVFNPKEALSASSFIDYHYTKESKPKSSTTLIITNTNKQKLNKLSLVIKNTGIEKKYAINGSDNGKDWFAVIQNQTLSPLNNNTDNIIQTIYFPTISYRYLQLVINDSATAPINIVKVGNIKDSLLNETLIDIRCPNTTIDNNNSIHKTTITLLFNGAQVIDKIGFNITEPTYYKRNAKILVPREPITKKRKELVNDVIFDFELNSNNKNFYSIPSTQTEKLIIEIDNENNPPLYIANLELKQNVVYLIADLKSNVNYNLMMGDKTLLYPNYDLSYFVNKLPTEELQLSSPATIVAPATATNSFWQNRYFMWICLIIGALVIVYFSYKLLKDIK